MSRTVPRTCTELDTNGDRGIILSEPKPLSAFRQAQAYVLLGDPGSGKTTEFQQESEALGASAVFLSARQFIRSEVDSHPEWRGKTLFIDGLDEMRAGKRNRMTPLDQIITQLERLGRPSFRLSCREADWLGDSDRRELEGVSPDAQMTTLRLDPLDDDGIRALLIPLDLPDDVEEFINQARQHGLGAILHNPQTLTLLAAAVDQGGRWPESRQETFESACQKMASEWNEEHLERANFPRTDVIMDAAGFLCALQLLAGTEGYLLSRRFDSASFPSVEELQDPPTQLPDNSLRQALSTRLFTGVVERRFSPVHRHIAEFLAGRYLAKLIEEGLPVERLMALMTSPSDQRVVTVLRGLSAWLAAHSPTARRRLIDLDPVGVGLYGDIKDLRPDDKRLILESLAAFAEQGPLFGHERTDDRGGWHMGSTTQAFRSLASAEMVPAIKELIAQPVAGSCDIRVLDFVLDVLSVAEDSELVSLRELACDLELIVRDPTRPEEIKAPALDAFIRIVPSGEATTNTLIRLLRDIKSGVVPDPHDQLRGTLLSTLYPSPLSPSQVWQYAMPRDRHNVVGRFSFFLHHDLLEDSSAEQVAELLDALYEDASNLVPALLQYAAGDLPCLLLARGLEECGEEVELPRIYRWLSIIAGSLYEVHWDGQQLRPIQEWLEGHPHIQKAVFLDWLRRRNQTDPTGVNASSYCEMLLESTLPPDFGQWCLGKAAELASTEPKVAQDLLEDSYYSLQVPATSDGLSLDSIRSQTQGHGALARRLEELCAPPTYDPERSEYQQRRQARIAEQEEQERQRQQDWDAQLRSQESELRANRFSPPNMHALARAYFGTLSGTDKDAAPRQRFSELIGGDPDLVDAVMVALRDAAWRDDVPSASETISLSLDSKQSWLAYPLMASLDLLSGEDPALLDQFDDTQKRNALAIYYCHFSRFMNRPNRPTVWFDRWLEQDPEPVADVLFNCARAAMRAGEQVLPGLSELERMKGSHPDLARELTARLLSSFPVRAHETQIPLLDRLLHESIRAGKPDLGQLVEEKLSMSSMTVAQRIRWLAAGTLLSPERHLAPLEEYAGENQQRIRHLAGFLCNRLRSHRFAGDPLVENLSPQAVAALMRLMGPMFEPFEVHGGGVGWVTPELDASRWIQDQISMLGSKASCNASVALKNLINNPRLSRWKDHLRWAEERQRVLLRDATYTHPSIEQVQRTIHNDLPANAADLAALLNDHLDYISRDIRGSSSNIWRQFWNEKPVLTAKHEDACRDALLAMLQARLPSEVDAAREGHYVSDKRADIRVTFGGFNVPIEIKKDCHRDLWRALQEQLVEQYTTDPETSGHGIYLVLWTGGDKVSRRPDGNRPTTPDELRELLEGDLTAEQTKKISIRVLDVTKP
ncbi:MAG: hypothetical protein KTV68_10635 [Acidimicrobiia bacterium]|nr:hypothetical protein [Acidimicrobiia bacterium]MCY4434172.1 hypothetical protein [bacterium]